MAARVPASQLDPLSELEEGTERPAKRSAPPKPSRPAKAAPPPKPVRVPVRRGSLVDRPRALSAAPFVVIVLVVVGTIVEAFAAPRVAAALFVAGAGTFAWAFGVLAVRLKQLEGLRRRARPTESPPDPHRTIDVGIGREVFQLETPALPVGHPYRDRATAERHFLVGDIAAARSMLLRAMGTHATVAGLGCIPLVFLSRPHDEPAFAELDRLAMANEEGLPTPRLSRMFLEQPRPAVADLNGDGRRDVIVMMGGTAERPETALAAFDGTSLETLWTSEARPVTWPAQPLVITYRYVFFVDAAGLITIHERETGVILQTAKLGPGKAYCSVADADGVWFADVGQPSFALFGDEAVPREVERPEGCAWPRLAQRGGGIVGNMTWQTFDAGDYWVGLGDDRVLKKRDHTMMRGTSSSTGLYWTEP
ncbi:MAG: hypothetical protein HOV80_05680 [Polyangiaceae bacterium]|nr:hypothetical protein [Polyangiaceae bacterium]